MTQIERTPAESLEDIVYVLFCLRHLVPLTDLKPVNPVPAWNVAAPIRKGDLGLFSPGSTLSPLSRCLLNSSIVPPLVMSFPLLSRPCLYTYVSSARRRLSWSATSPPSLLQEVSWQQRVEGGGASDVADFLRRPDFLRPAPPLPASRPPSPATPPVTRNHDL